ncbi:DUF938 domain-containing protein [uncultured Amphritea sp.]|uniref:DUF938 domain-containing protein n=1 Tax=uncultured Amphritea sp. TaxID=981605 RepID=UPI002622B03D|nr:DUF938 domain-containing protein [uncultured Amphritea sp.]
MTGENYFLGFSPASARNRTPILEALVSLLKGDEAVLEIGSGSGQHAVHFCQALPSLRWLPSEVAQQLPLLQANLEAHGCDNIHPPVLVDLQHPHWSSVLPPVELVYSANTLHIISWTEVTSLFNGVGAVLEPAGRLILYGPFRYNNCFTSEGNAEFDCWLKERNPDSGIRDFEQIDSLARGVGLILETDISMPANNQLLVWKKT